MPNRQQIKNCRPHAKVKQSQCQRVTSSQRGPMNLVTRNSRRREAAELARFKRDEKFSDLCVDNMVLEEELVNHNKHLEKIEFERQTILNDIIAKQEVLNDSRELVASDLAAELIQSQWNDIYQLHTILAADLTSNITPTPSPLASPDRPNATLSFNCSA